MDPMFLFDVDGTLTPARQPMVKAFAEFFERFATCHPVYLVSGSHYAMICEQVPEPIIQACRGIFGSSGCEYYQKGVLVHQRTHVFDPRLLRSCEAYVGRSHYPDRFGNHIEARPGMINVSVVGRNATQSQRSAYFDWDETHQERRRFTQQTNQEFPAYEASMGGQISVDIVPRGWNKASVKAALLADHPNARLIFFGDRMSPGGNDHPLAEALKSPEGRHQAIAVSSYRDTENWLRQWTAQNQQQ